MSTLKQKCSSRVTIFQMLNNLVCSPIDSKTGSLKGLTNLAKCTDGVLKKTKTKEYAVSSVL